MSLKLVCLSVLLTLGHVFGQEKQRTSLALLSERLIDLKSSERVRRISKETNSTPVVLDLTPPKNIIETNTFVFNLEECFGEEKRIRKDTGELVHLFENATYTSDTLGVSIGKMGSDEFSFNHTLHVGGITTKLRFLYVRWRYPVGSTSPMGKSDQVAGFAFQCKF